MHRLSSTEYQFMELIWQHSEGISSGEIYDLFPQSLSTKSTILSRILKKGCAICKRKAKQVYYYPNITKREYEKLILQEDIEKNMGFSSFQKLFAAFCGKSKLTPEQTQQLEQLIEQLENDE